MTEQDSLCVKVMLCLLVRLLYCIEIWLMNREHYIHFATMYD